MVLPGLDPEEPLGALQAPQRGTSLSLVVEPALDCGPTSLRADTGSGHCGVVKWCSLSGCPDVKELLTVTMLRSGLLWLY